MVQSLRFVHCNHNEVNVVQWLSVPPAIAASKPNLGFILVRITVAIAPTGPVIAEVNLNNATCSEWLYLLAPVNR